MHHVTINQNNQKKGRQKEGNLSPRKLSPKNQKVLPKDPGSNRIPQVPPKEQEATKSPKCLQKNRNQQHPLPPLKPIHSQ
jgi:hypothetical protein